jgi:hypothetical protein
VHGVTEPAPFINDLFDTFCILTSDDVVAFFCSTIRRDAVFCLCALCGAGVYGTRDMVNQYSAQLVASINYYMKVRERAKEHFGVKLAFSRACILQEGCPTTFLHTVLCCCRALHVEYTALWL